MNALTRALTIAAVVAVVGGFGTWAINPALVEDVLGKGHAVVEGWRDDAGRVRQAGSDWWGGVLRKGADVIDSVRQIVGLEPSAPETAAPNAPAAPPVPSVRYVVWATADGQLLRAAVPGQTHDDFVSVLRQTQAEDLNRLARLAGKRFRQEAEPLVADVVGRVPAFMTEVLGGSAQYAAMSESFAGIEPGQEAAALKAAALRLVSERLEGLYRRNVLIPDTTVSALTGVAGKVIAEVRVDLIRACDRYDDAFRSFLRANVKDAEALSSDGRWVAVPWQGSSASFRSLCQTLRAAGVASSWFDEAVIRTVAEPSMAAHDLIRELARPAADVVEWMIKSYDGAYGTLSAYGLPQSLARASALVWSYGASSPAVARHVLGFGVPAELRNRVEPALAEATRVGLLDVVDSLNAAMVTFVSGELAGMASGVTARVDGSWSRR